MIRSWKVDMQRHVKLTYDGKLKVPEDAEYLVVSQVYFSDKNECKKLTNPAIGHYIKYNDGKVLKSNNNTARECLSNLRTNVHLKKGDKVYVEIKKPTLLHSRPDATYFELIMRTPSVKTNNNNEK